MTEETGTVRIGVRAQVAIPRRPQLSCRSCCWRSLKALRSRLAAIGMAAEEALWEECMRKERKRKMVTGLLRWYQLSCRFHYGRTGEVFVCVVLGRAQRLAQVGGSHAIMKLRSSGEEDGSLQIFKRSGSVAVDPGRAEQGVVLTVRVGVRSRPVVVHLDRRIESCRGDGQGRMHLQVCSPHLLESKM